MVWHLLIFCKGTIRSLIPLLLTVCNTSCMERKIGSNFFFLHPQLTKKSYLFSLSSSIRLTGCFSKLKVEWAFIEKIKITYFIFQQKIEVLMLESKTHICFGVSLGYYFCLMPFQQISTTLLIFMIMHM